MADNKLVFETRVSKETQAFLYDEMIFAGLVNTQMSTEFSDPKAGMRVLVKRATTLQAYEWKTGADKVIQSVDQTANYIAIDKMIDCSFDITTKDWTFFVNDFVNEFLKPGVIAVAEEADTHILKKMYQGTQKVVEGVTSNPSTVNDLTKIHKAARKMKIRSSEAVAVIGLEGERLILNIPNIIEADKRADNGVAFRNANVGVALGVAYYSSEKVDDVFEDLEASTIVDGTLTVQAAVAQYDEKVVLTGGTAGQVIAEGQMLKAGSVTFTAAKRVVVPAGGVVIVDTVGVTDAIAATTAVTKVSGGSNFLFAKDAVAFVSIAPAIPKSAVLGQVITDAESNVTMRMYIVWNETRKSDVFTLDLYVAAKVMDPRRIARF